jgi:uncharacterized protein YdeI (YjbR/CyaY-like superfamily)
MVEGKRNASAKTQSGRKQKSERAAKEDSARTELQRTFADRKAWEKWLHENHAATNGIWIQLAKVTSGIASVTHAEALEVALCYGWIDGQIQPLDENYTLRRFIPRRKNSMWSQVNRAKALDLIKQGRMQSAGLAAIEQAKANGRWDAAYQPPSNKALPPDLERALKESPKAASFFKSLNGQNRYAILFRLQTAKAETRAKRLAKFVGMLERGETLY